MATMTWDAVAHIVRNYRIPLWLKGVNTGDDARRAVDLGADVIYVSGTADDSSITVAAASMRCLRSPRR